jgi:hypothetical protein
MRTDRLPRTESVGTPRRPPSGSVLVILGVLIVAGYTAVQALWGPTLRQQVLEQRSPRTLREPVGTGEAASFAWEAIGRFDGARDCVTVRFAGNASAPACQGEDVAIPVQSVALHPLGEGLPTVVYGAVSKGTERVRVDLVSGSPIQTVPSGSQYGFAVDLYGVAVPPGTTVQRVVALDAQGRELGTAAPAPADRGVG